MEEHINFLAKVVGQNEDGKNIVKLFTLSMDNNTFSYEKTDIDELDWDDAKKQFSVVGMIH